MSDLIKDFSEMLTGNLAGFSKVMMFALVAWLLSIPIKKTLRYLPGSLGRSLSGPLGDLLQIALVGVGVFFGARYAGVDVTVLLAITAIITAGLSLALDTSVKDALAAGKILAAGYYRVGESISFDHLTGKVHNITLFATTLYISDRGLVTVGNAKVADGPISNHSREPVEMPIRIPVMGGKFTRTKLLTALHDLAMANDHVVGVKVTHAWEPGGSEVFVVYAKVDDYDRRKQIATAVSINISNMLESSSVELGEVSLRRQI